MKHNWITLGITAAVLTGLAGAQTITPTLGDGHDVVVSGTTTASVEQKVHLKLPEATAIHIGATNLVFNIADVGKQDQDKTWYCAYGIPGKDGVAHDVASNLGANFWNQTQVLPLGTWYTPNMSTFGTIDIHAGGKVTAYPPVILKDGKVDNASKAYFVCYRTFVMQKFSNVGNFKLSVSRDTPPANGLGNQLMYIQDNPCHVWGQGTGLYSLPVGGVRELIPMSMTKGTTGQAASGKTNALGEKVIGGEHPKFCREQTSWLDDLVVVAMVVDGDLAGDNVATLTYTLASSSTPFK